MTEEKNILSEREDQILQLVAKGMTNREIAQALTISPNTVKVHLSNIFEKLGVSSRTEATLYGIEHGLVSVPGNEKEDTEDADIAQPFFQKYLWVLIPVIVILLAAVLLLLFGRGLIFPEPTPTPTQENAVVIAEMEDRWQELAPLPEARTGLAATAYDGNIYAIAGEGLEGVSGSVFRYLMEEDRWESLAEKPTPVRDVEAALVGEKIYVPGGLMADGLPTDILEIYDPRTNQWDSGASLPIKLSAYAMTDFEGQLYLLGGWDGEKALDNVFIYDPGADEWREGTPMPTAGWDLGATAIQDKIIVLGGKNERDVISTIEIYQPSREGSSEEIWMVRDAADDTYTSLGIQSFGDLLFTVYQISESEIQVLQYIIQDDRWILSDTQSGLPIMPDWAITSMVDHIYLVGSERIDNEVTGCLYKFKAVYISLLPNIEY